MALWIYYWSYNNSALYSLLPLRMITSLPTSKEELYEWVEEYCHEWIGENDCSYYHEMINDESMRKDELSRGNVAWECFIEWATEKHVGLCDNSSALHAKVESYKEANS